MTGKSDHLDFLDHAGIIAGICQIPPQTLGIRFDEIKALRLPADEEFRLLVVAVGSLMLERLATTDQTLAAQAGIWWASAYMSKRYFQEGGEPCPPQN